MRKFLKVAGLTSSALLLSACQMALPAYGTFKDGKPASGAVTAVIGAEAQSSVSINMPDGSVCRGVYKKNDTAERRLPLSCDNGDTGKAIVTVHNQKKYNEYADLTFRLSNGVAGSISTNAKKPASAPATEGGESRSKNKKKVTVRDLIVEAQSNGQQFLVLRAQPGYPNSVGGVNAYISAVNTSGKTLKYLTFHATPYNRVGDAVMGEIRRVSTMKLDMTGPYQTGAYVDGTWENVWYNNTIDCLSIVRIDLTYMDGSRKSYVGYEQVGKVMPIRPNSCSLASRVRN